MVEMAEDKNLNTNEPDGSNANLNPDGGGEPKQYDEKFVKELQTETIQRRKKIAELEAKLKEIEDAKLTETEKDKKKITELEKQLLDIQGSVKAEKVDNLILKAITGKNIIDTDTAVLLIRKELESVEEITDKEVSKAVDTLLKAKPFLINSGGPNPSNGNFAKTENNTAPKDGVEVLKKFVGGYIR